MQMNSIYQVLFLEAAQNFIQFAKRHKIFKRMHGTLCGTPPDKPYVFLRKDFFYFAGGYFFLAFAMNNNMHVIWHGLGKRFYEYRYPGSKGLNNMYNGHRLLLLVAEVFYPERWFWFSFIA